MIGISQDLMVPDASVSETRPTLEKFLAEKGLDTGFPVFLFDADTLDGLNELYDLPGPIPVTLAMDANGRIVDRQEGTAGVERFREMMRKALDPGTR